MKYLAIDASTEACSVALTLPDNACESRFELCPQSHSTVLLPMVDDVLKTASCSLQDIEGIIFGRGPGSFTGVRIGVGVVQGLAFSAQLPVVGVSTLQAMAQQAFDEKEQKQVIAAIDARMGEVYCCSYRVDENGIMQAQTAEAVLKPELVAEYFSTQTSPSYGVGTGWAAYKKELASLIMNAEEENMILYPDAKAMLGIGKQGFQQGLAVAAEAAQPVYVRDTVSWKKLPGRE